jgi:hypothetical protein
MDEIAPVVRIELEKARVPGVFRKGVNFSTRYIRVFPVVFLESKTPFTARPHFPEENEVF